MSAVRTENGKTHEKLAEDIRKDLIATLRSKGIEVSMVNIEMNPDNVSIEVYIKGQME
ncbi:MAG: hypothetical protein Q8920_15905 [Bacillota bacterium]|nr:hypothetical protein [Bacillota bacterium]